MALPMLSVPQLLGIFVTLLIIRTLWPPRGPFGH